MIKRLWHFDVSLIHAQRDSFRGQDM